MLLEHNQTRFEHQLMPRVFIIRAIPALSHGSTREEAPWRWRWGLIYSNLVVGGRRWWCWGGCLAPVTGLSVTVWSFENHLPPPCSPPVPGLGRWGSLSPSSTPHYLLIKSTLHRAKRDNGGKVGRLHSLSQEEEVPWCTFTCVWRLAEAVATTRCTVGGETASMLDQRAARLTCCVSCYCNCVEWPSEACRTKDTEIMAHFYLISKH